MEIKQSPDQPFDDFLLTPRGDKLIRINISRNTLIAFIVSVLLHAIILLLVLPQIKIDNAASSPPPIEVSLAPPKAPEKVVEEVLPEPPIPEEIIEPIEKPKPKTKVITQKPRPDAKPPAFKVPDVLATTKPSPETMPPKEAVSKDAPTDMMAYVNQQRAKRQATEADAAKQNADAVAKEAGPTENQKRDERIKNNLIGGAGGTFTTMSVTGRRATFSFNGWVNNLSNAKQQYFEVEAQPGQDVRLLMIKRIISFINETYKADFPWDSQRLGKVITLSARPEDRSGLEDFLMTEFFGPNYKNAP